MRETFRAFVENGVPFTIATDGPEMMRTHLRDEFELLRRIGALDEDEAQAANERGHEASFVGRRATRRRVVHRYTLRPMEPPRPRVLVSSACRHSEIHQASRRGSGRSSS